MVLSCLQWSQGEGWHLGSWMLYGMSQHLLAGEEERPSVLLVGRRWGMLPRPLYRRPTSLHTGRGWLVGTLLATVMETRE